jgi:hypothetical protein
MMTVGSELDGDSEYFPVKGGAGGGGRGSERGGGRGRDALNNDELDRLLVQARKVRAAY